MKFLYIPRSSFVVHRFMLQSDNGGLDLSTNAEPSNLPVYVLSYNAGFQVSQVLESSYREMSLVRLSFLDRGVSYNIDRALGRD